MLEEAFCSIHGPYDALYSTCPYCSGSYKRPLPPKALEEDETDGQAGSQPPRSWTAGGEAPTRLESPPKTQKRFLDDEAEELAAEAQEADVTLLDVTPSGLLGILWVAEGSQRGRLYKIEDGTFIARKSEHVSLGDPKVSNPHARLTVEAGQFVVWDCGSKNGTFVNGNRIREATPLKENDVLRMGDTTLVLKVLPPSVRPGEG